MAIAITLLVLRIEIPEFDGTPSSAALTDAVVDLIPNIITFVWSFLLVARFWSIHRRLFSGLRRVDSRLVWLNTTFLLLIALLPFPSDLLGRFDLSLLSVTLFASLIAAVGIVISMMELYVARHPDLIDAESRSDEMTMDLDLWDMFFTPAIFLLSIGVAIVDADVAPYTWFLLALRRPFGNLRHRSLTRATPSGR